MRNPEQASKFRRLIELATDQQHPIWVEGDIDSNSVSEETEAHSGQPRMFTQLDVSKSFRGVLEVVFDSNRNRISGGDREVYLRALNQLRDELYRKFCIPPPFHRVGQRLATLENAQSHPKADQSAAVSFATIAELTLVLDAARIETMRRIEGHLSALEGTRLDSLHANQILAKNLHRLLDGHGYRVRCSECGEPAIMRCLATGNSVTGSFVFDHYLSRGRTFHGGRSSIPKLAVIPKPARQASPVN